MSYKVYRVASAGLPRDHHTIFVETNDDHSGWTFQVEGNIQNGMSFVGKDGERPQESATYQGKQLLGKVTPANFRRIQPICESIPVPKKQFEGPRRLFPQEPLRRCQEWTQEVIEALINAQVLEK